MSRTVANFVAVAAGIVTAGLLMTLPPEPNMRDVVIFAVPFIAAFAVLRSRWSDPVSNTAQIVAFFVLMMASAAMLAPLVQDRGPRETSYLVSDLEALRDVAIAIRGEVDETGAFPRDLLSTLRTNNVRTDRLHSKKMRRDPAAPLMFKTLDPETGFFQLGDFIWVYSDLDPADYAGHVIGFDVQLDRPARVVVYGDARQEIASPKEFALIIAEENHRREERGLKPISNEITQIAAEKR